MGRIAEIQARLAEINAAIDAASGEDLTNLETESRSLLAELEGLKAEIAARQQLRQSIAAGAGTPVATPSAAQPSTEERAAKEFVNTNRMSVGAEQARSVLVSSGTLARTTEVDGINDIPGAKVSSLIDLIHVENCEGMGTHRVAYTDADADEAVNQVEGQAAAVGNLGAFDFVDIKPESVAVLDYISKQAKKQTPLQYANKVRNQALLALRKKANTVAVAALKTSELVKKVPATAGKIEAGTLRKLVMEYGDDESVIGGAMLFLNKADLIAFGDVRGTNEKKALYEINPDASGNTGTIKEGGLSVRYCINSKLTALSSAVEGAGVTMFYGNPKALELDLFSDYEVKVSEDFAFDKLMDTIRGDVELGAGVIVKNGFIALNVE